MTQLRQKWTESIEDLTCSVLLELPPEREVTHQIQLIDPNLKDRNHPPKCAKAYQAKFLEKLQRYVKARWWVPCNSPSAPPMLVLPKTSGDGIRTVVDARD